MKAALTARPMIRPGLHPVDLRHEFSRNDGVQILKRLLDEGPVPMTKAIRLTLQNDRSDRAA